MKDDERVYTGVVPLGNALNSVVLTSKGERSRVRRPTIREETYKGVVKWMEPYATRISFNEEEGKFEVSGKPVMPSVSELKEEFGMTPYALRRLAEEYDTVFVVTLNKDISKEKEEKHVELAGMYKGVQYVILQSLYPQLAVFLSEKKPTKSNV